MVTAVVARLIWGKIVPSATMPAPDRPEHSDRD